ncbi:bifunctional 2-polyprenyl-6-hydroxyphenol methylase/3-demethylubiquinol 3-O-methyltransferase UbiG [Cellulomonas sp. PhB143]|uniref:class I SAM-dependent methyltransferase n=1 Tax=Cellulomonas sp. PhB143 TaxID=2485186 RepID=UPI000F488B40|nr:methyltransferase domain-containing protein [Cellulomonas sp. PhB143]ROS75377.1 methyltransferase family protein [Cellulomonas sp. PhB143]
MESSEDFWENHYRRLSEGWGARPNARLVELVGALAPAPGRALDLGCGHGADALWLAGRGWAVTAVDVSATALDRVAAAAQAAGLADHVSTERHDLSVSRPEGPFDLVTASYFQTPLDVPRAPMVRGAAALLATGGLLLVVDHGSAAPWSWDPDATFPTPEETRAGLDLGDGWETVLLDAPQRVASGPDGATATVTDLVVVLRRR